MKALVIFSDAGVHWAAPMLKQGFRHVAVAVLNEGYWIGIDPVMGVPDIRVIAGQDADLAGHYRAEGFTVIETWTRKNDGLFPLALANCVGAVKAILGINAPLIWTPLQLHRHMTKGQPA